jgi:PAS domain-containing protein
VVLPEPGLEAITGFSVAESLGTPFLDHMHPVDKGRYLNMLTYAMDDGGGHGPGRVPVPHPGGQYLGWRCTPASPWTPTAWSWASPAP